MNGLGGPLVMLHLATMALMAILFVRTAVHHRLGFRARGVRPARPPLPPALIWLACGALAYFLLVFLLPFATHGEGWAELRDGREVWVTRDSVVRALPAGSVAAFDSALLRAFSAGWLFFGLLVALASHIVEARILAYRAALRRASA